MHGKLNECEIPISKAYFAPRTLKLIYVDSIENKIYLGGFFYLADSIRAIEIAVWDGTHWDSLGNGLSFGQYNLAILKFKYNFFVPAL